MFLTLYCPRRFLFLVVSFESTCYQILKQVPYKFNHLEHHPKRLFSSLMSLSEKKLETLGELNFFIWARIASSFGEYLN